VRGYVIKAVVGGVSFGVGMAVLLLVTVPAPEPASVSPPSLPGSSAASAPAAPGGTLSAPVTPAEASPTPGPQTAAEEPSAELEPPVYAHPDVDVHHDDDHHVLRHWVCRHRWWC
jgi:hypothetical protein